MVRTRSEVQRWDITENNPSYSLYLFSFANQLRISGILSWDGKYYPSYLKHAVTSALFICCNGTHTHGRQVTSVLSQSDVII